MLYYISVNFALEMLRGSVDVDDSGSVFRRTICRRFMRRCGLYRLTELPTHAGLTSLLYIVGVVVVVNR
jgi:hypothetical protein